MDTPWCLPLPACDGPPENAVNAATSPAGPARLPGVTMCPWSPLRHRPNAPAPWFGDSTVEPLSRRRSVQDVRYHTRISLLRAGRCSTGNRRGGVSWRRCTCHRVKPHGGAKMRDSGGGTCLRALSTEAGKGRTGRPHPSAGGRRRPGSRGWLRVPFGRSRPRWTAG